MRALGFQAFNTSSMFNKEYQKKQSVENLKSWAFSCRWGPTGVNPQMLPKVCRLPKFLLSFDCSFENFPYDWGFHFLSVKIDLPVNSTLRTIGTRCSVGNLDSLNIHRMLGDVKTRYTSPP